MNNIDNVVADLRLKFQIDHPAIEDCYGFGYECAKANLDESENPFAEHSIEHEQWSEGWWDGFYEQAPLFDLVTESKENVLETEAANDQSYGKHKVFFMKFLKITGAIAASAVVGYQVIDLVA